MEPVHVQTLRASPGDVCTAGTRPLPPAATVPFMRMAVPILLTPLPPRVHPLPSERGKAIN